MLVMIIMRVGRMVVMRRSRVKRRMLVPWCPHNAVSPCTR
jgi:hypothetical protein